LVGQDEKMEINFVSMILNKLNFFSQEIRGYFPTINPFAYRITKKHSAHVLVWPLCFHPAPIYEKAEGNKTKQNKPWNIVTWRSVPFLV